MAEQCGLCTISVPQQVFEASIITQLLTDREFNKHSLVIYLEYSLHTYKIHTFKISWFSFVSIHCTI